MKAFKELFATFGIVLLVSSCAKPLISNLQKGTYHYKTTDDDVLDVSVSVLPLAKPVEEQVKPKTFFDLRDSLPHIYLKILSSKIDDPDKLISYLSKPLTEVPKKTTEKKATDFTLYKVRFSFSNLKKYYNYGTYMHPNTRLEYLTTSLSVPPGIGIVFYNIDKLENEYDEIDLGTLSRDQTVSLNAKIAAEVGLGSSFSSSSSDKNTNTTNDQNANKQNIYDEKGTLLGTIDKTGTLGGNKESNTTTANTTEAKAKGNAEVGYLNSQTIKEAVAVKLRRLRTGFNFSPNKLTIAQRGRLLGDISDNIYVTTTFKISNPASVFSLNVYDFDKLFGVTNEPLKADELTFSSRIVNFLPCDNAHDIDLTTDYEGAIRVVGNEAQNDGVNALEYDDKVTYCKFGNKPGNKLTFDKNLYCKNAYKITAKDKSGNPFVLKIATPNPEELDVFVDDKPELLLQWIIEQMKNPDSTKLTTSKLKMYFENTRINQIIYLVNNSFTASNFITLKSLIDVKAEKRLP